MLAGFDLDTLDVRWRHDQDHGGHLLLYTATGEVVTGDHADVVVRDVVSGDELARAGSPLAAHLARDTDCGAPPDAIARRPAAPRDSRIEHESTRAAQQPGPHGGPGMTTGHTFFADAAGLGFVFRKRVLHRGAGIGLHFHDHDEVYYVVSGRGRYTLDGRDTDVGPGHALLTRVGSTHGMQQVGDEDLVLIIAYPPKPAGH